MPRWLKALLSMLSAGIVAAVAVITAAATDNDITSIELFLALAGFFGAVAKDIQAQMMTPPGDD